MKRFYTIGMAGHIDHGKTALTKALTNVDTDRLKEEKERNISIEPGFAPFINNEDLQISIVDVPGHERFIRQMIAGVAGIDLVILAVAADEGVMPQTREHLSILSFLGIKKGIIAITKANNVEPSLLDLAKQEIESELRGTSFENAPCICVDSLTFHGIEELKNTILNEITQIIPKSNRGNFRLPIDQVFSIKGQGTVARGTIFNGEVQIGQDVWVLPQKRKGTVRSIQVQHQTVEKAIAGQRTALNLSGISRDEIKRGNVIVTSYESFPVTQTIDVSLKFVQNLKYPIKQRMPVTFHVGTSEVMGTIVFFDRNEIIQEEHEVLCQIRLNEPIVVKRGDAFIIRRPSPVETIGGGWILDPFGKRYKFGDQTIAALALKKEGKVEERIMALLQENQVLSVTELATLLHIDAEEVNQTVSNFPCFQRTKSGAITLVEFMEKAINRLSGLLQKFHTEFPMRIGFDKARLLQELDSEFSKDLIESVLETDHFTRVNQFIKVSLFRPHIPLDIKSQANQLLHLLEQDGYRVKPIDEYGQVLGITGSTWNELLNFLEREKQIIRLNENLVWREDIYNQAIQKCRSAFPVAFTIADAKTILPLSRKYLIPFLELLDEKGITKRMENKRVWLDKLIQKAHF
ncbi:selenocysteine-specific translation elongation factor [Bacillus litorisediminis]|uniref:selenocysteine-specific translation elongation factor n=1 Tax=Bacillus litorisediminis TaxID=2922713 RepID=UPI001FAFB606|nr:selenocysteine-specific translation elongation factor [Bacillus litorisediminis]